MLIKTENENYILAHNISLLLPQKYGEKVENFLNHDYPDLHEKELIKFLRSPIDNSEVFRYLSNTSNLTLQLTRDCNFRCKYCVFSGIYNLRRDHENISMSVEIAKRAIDFFYKTISSPWRSTLRKEVTVTFYGGEALIELETMLECVKYINEISKNDEKFKYIFYLPTNGLLLKPDLVKKLIDHNFRFDISIDGPQEEHDKFRVTKGEKKTWQIVMSNIKYIKEKYPDFFQEKVRFYITIHPDHDISKLEEFFLDNDDIFNMDNSFVSEVNISDDLDEEKRIKWEKSRDELYKKLYNDLDKDKWFYKALVIKQFDQNFSRAIRILRNTDTFTGNCYPCGSRLFVDVDGTFHTCERINEHFPVGDIEKGYNINAIKRYIKEWNEEIIRLKCWDCCNWYFCGECAAVSGKQGKFRIDEKECGMSERFLKFVLPKYLNIKEKEDDKKNRIDYSSINAFLESL